MSALLENRFYDAQETLTPILPLYEHQLRLDMSMKWQDFALVRRGGSGMLQTYLRCSDQLDCPFELGSRVHVDRTTHKVPMAVKVHYEFHSIRTAFRWMQLMRRARSILRKKAQRRRIAVPLLHALMPRDVAGVFESYV